MAILFSLDFKRPRGGTPIAKPGVVRNGMIQTVVILSMLVATSGHCEVSQAVARVHSVLATAVPEHPEPKKEVTQLDDENFRLPEFLDYMRYKKPTSKKEFAKYLPKGCRKYWEPVYRSRATKCASAENPRLIVWCSSDSTSFNIAIDGDVGAEATADCQKVEILDSDEKGKGSSAEIIWGLNEKTPKPGNILENQSRCTGCHTPQLRRVADEYPHWPGFLQSIQKIIKRDSIEGNAHKTLVERMADTSSHYSEFYPLVEAVADVPDEKKEHFYSLRLGDALGGEKDYSDSTPVSVLFNGLNRTHEKQVANYLMHHPSFSSFKYALAASALGCSDLEKFLPSEFLQSKGRESLAAVKAGLLKKIQSSAKRVKEEVSRYNTPIELSDIDVYSAEETDRIAELFFLGQFMGINPSVLSTSVHATEFSLPTGSFNALKFYFNPGYGNLVEQNAEQQALSNRTKAEGKTLANLCEELKTDSLKALAAWTLPKPTEILEQASIELKSPAKPAIQTALGKCVACHSEYLHKAFKAPRIPFENEGSLQESFKADPGLAKRIQSRIHLSVFHEMKMPPNEGLTSLELQALEEFAR